MARYATGDDAAFSEVYDEVAPRLSAFLLRQTRDPVRAEDLLQQTLLHVHRARGHFVPGAPVIPWVFAIARRLLIDEQRRAVRRSRVLEPGSPPEVADRVHTSPQEALEVAALAAQLTRELARLPEPQREAFELVRLDGLTLAEAADATGSTVSALKSRTHRAYDTLRSALAGWFEGAG